MGFMKTLRRKLRIKLSLMKERRRRHSLYPRVIPQHLSQIDLGEELMRVPSLTSLQPDEQQGDELTRVPSLTSLQPDEQLGDELARVSSATSLQSDSSLVQESPTEELQLETIENCTHVESSESFISQEILWPINTRRMKNVQLVELRVSAGSKLSGYVMVANLAYHKNIFIRWTVDSWSSHQDQVARYHHSSEDLSYDSFVFSIDPRCVDGRDPDSGMCVELAVAYQVSGMEFWDNNRGQNFGLLLK